MNTPYVFKRCTKCGETLPATTEYFHKAKGGKYGLRGKCKKCEAEYGKQYREDNKDKERERYKQYYENNKDKIKQYREDNKDKIAERNKQWYENNKDKILEQHKQWRENNKNYMKQYREDNKDKLREQRKQYYEDNKDKIAEQHKQWYEDNKDKILEQHKQYNKQYYEDNKDKKAEYGKQYREDNKDKISEWHKQHYENNKDKLREQKKQYRATPQGQATRFNSSCRRRIKKQNQGNGITKDQWLEMMNFFNWKCAYSSEVLSEKGQRSIDHIKPLVKGGEHEVWNTVPMYRPYNSSKQDKDMEKWYQEQEFYSEERLQKIYEWQEYTYNKYSKK